MVSLDFPNERTHYANDLHSLCRLIPDSQTRENRPDMSTAQSTAAAFRGGEASRAFGVCQVVPIGYPSAIREIRKTMDDLHFEVERIVDYDFDG